MAAMESQRNTTEYSVSEISQAVKRTVEDAFGYVRVRGEISGFRGVHASGHSYFSLKDEKARLEAVIWRTTLQRLKFKPEEGVEVIATGRVTTYAGQSKYQIVIEALEPAGVGALMALLEERRKKLAAEGLFATERKRPLPYLPRTIGVVSSPTGSVIRDILHRLAERFPTHVVLWPVRVQGETSASEVAAAIRGFNRLSADATVKRPDVIIVARGGGSLEDLWGFNDEDVVRAVAGSSIPVVAAIGHETDVTLIDHAADRRAPTPSAAAEMAVPVRAELLAAVAKLAARLSGATARGVDSRRRDLNAVARVLPRPDDLLANQRRAVDGLGDRINLALSANARAHRAAFERIGGRLATDKLARILRRASERSEDIAARGRRAGRVLADARRTSLGAHAARLSVTRVQTGISRGGERVRDLDGRARQAWRQIDTRRRARLDGLANLLEALSYRGVLARGFALVTDEQRRAIRSVADAGSGRVLSIRFHDGDVDAVSRGARTRARGRKPSSGNDSQGSLL